MRKFAASSSGRAENSFVSVLPRKQVPDSAIPKQQLVDSIEEVLADALRKSSRSVDRNSESGSIVRGYTIPFQGHCIQVTLEGDVF